MYQRTIQDKFISGFNGIRYSISEPIFLRIVRALYEHHYSDSQETPLVSIAIPTYNRGKLLVERTLPSIFAQTYKNIEIVIVGDCCPDDTVKLLRKVEDSRLRFFNLSQRTKYPNDPACRWFISGLVPLNKGMELARGKWIAYFDDDDIMAPDHVESLLRFAQHGNYEFVAGLYEEERDGQKHILGQKNADYPEFGGHGTSLYRSYLRCFKYNINSWRKVYNRPQDIDRQLRLRCAGVRMELLEKVVSCVAPRPGLNTVGLAARMIKPE
ncbi:MAG: glycosyltransferase family 2 protein [Candidatus Omnitrophota bacterium]